MEFKAERLSWLTVGQSRWANSQIDRLWFWYVSLYQNKFLISLKLFDGLIWEPFAPPIDRQEDQGIYLDNLLNNWDRIAYQHPSSQNERS